MKNFILLFLLLIGLAAHAQKIVPLKGSYQKGPIEIEVSKSYDDTWRSIIGHLSSQGISLTSTDKESGLMVVDVPSFKGKMSEENEDGSLVVPGAHIAMERTKGDFPGQTLRYTASGQWNIFVKPVSDSKTIVRVHLINLKTKGKVSKNVSGVSTGAFEKSVIAGIK